MPLTNHFIFQVTNKHVNVSTFRQYEGRGDCCLEMLCLLAGNFPDLFEGRTGSVFYHDRPPSEEMAAGELVFSTTLDRSIPNRWLPFPCFTSLRWPEVGVPDAEALHEELLSDDRAWVSPKVFWIGTDQHSSRRALWELGKQHPEAFDVELMEWNRANPKALVSQTRQVSILDHRNFKYLVDCPGRGYSGRLKWLIATGRPVFIVDREIVEPWHLEMIPWIHYVPVSADLSDLLEHHHRMENEPGLYENISRNARKFAAERLRLEPQLLHVAEKVREFLASRKL